MSVRKDLFYIAAKDGKVVHISAWRNPLDGAQARHEGGPLQWRAICGVQIARGDDPQRWAWSNADRDLCGNCRRHAGRVARDLTFLAGAEMSSNAEDMTIGHAMRLLRAPFSISPQALNRACRTVVAELERLAGATVLVPCDEDEVDTW